MEAIQIGGIVTLSEAEYRQLVDALKGALDALYNETYGKKNSPWIQRVKDAARAAIAKAEGRE